LAKTNYGRYEGNGYIESTGMKPYRSDPAEGDVQLRGKYRAGWITAPRQNKHSDNNRAAKKRITNKANFRPSKVMVMYPDSGHKVMMTRAAFADLDWGWVID
jgi:hypothetical protein